MKTNKIRRDIVKTNKVKLIASVLVLFLGFSLIGFGCAPAEDDEQVVRMSFTNHMGPGHPTSVIIEEMSNRWTEASDGKVEVTHYPSEALGSATEADQMVIEGSVDVAFFNPVYRPDTFPLSAFFELPFFATSNYSSTKVVQEIFNRGFLDDEFEDVVVLFANTTPPTQIYSNHKLTSVEDFRGLRLPGAGPAMARTWEILGAQPVAMSWGDKYLAIDRGVIDGCIGHWPGGVSWKWYEVCDYAHDINLLGGFFCTVLMNKDSWNKLSPELQEKWMVIGEEMVWKDVESLTNQTENAKNVWRDHGREVVIFPGDERSKLAEMTVPLWANWINNNGKVAEEMYRTYVEVMEDLGEPYVEVPAYLN